MLSCRCGLVVVDMLMGTGYCPVRTVRFRYSIHFDTNSVRNSGRHYWSRTNNIWFNLMKLWYRFSKELPRKIAHIFDINSVNLKLIH